MCHTATRRDATWHSYSTTRHTAHSAHTQITLKVVSNTRRMLDIFSLMFCQSIFILAFDLVSSLSAGCLRKTEYRMDT